MLLGEIPRWQPTMGTGVITIGFWTLLPWATRCHCLPWNTVTAVANVNVPCGSDTEMGIHTWQMYCDCNGVIQRGFVQSCLFNHILGTTQVLQNNSIMCKCCKTTPSWPVNSTMVQIDGDGRGIAVQSWKRMLLWVFETEGLVSVSSNKRHSKILCFHKNKKARSSHSAFTKIRKGTFLC